MRFRGDLLTMGRYTNLFFFTITPDFSADDNDGDGNDVSAGNSHHHRQPRRTYRHTARRNSREQNCVRQPAHIGPLVPARCVEWDI